MKSKQKSKKLLHNNKLKNELDIYFTPCNQQKKKFNQKMDNEKTRKRSLSKESLQKLKRKTSDHIKTERVRSYTNLKNHESALIRKIIDS